MDTIAFQQIAQDGYTILRRVFSWDPIALMKRQIETVDSESAPRVRQRSTSVYAIRDLLRHCPNLIAKCRHPMLSACVQGILGKECGFARGLFSDQPPGHSWAVPLLKVLTIEIDPPSHP